MAFWSWQKAWGTEKKIMAVGNQWKHIEITQGVGCGTVNLWCGLPLITQIHLCSILNSLHPVITPSRLMGKSHTPLWYNEWWSHHWCSVYPSSTTCGRAPFPSNSDGPGLRCLSVGYPQWCAGNCLTPGSASTLPTWMFVDMSFHGVQTNKSKAKLPRHLSKQH